MKKITFLLIIFIGYLLNAQTYTTGEIILFDNEEFTYTAQIDFEPSLVTLTLSGPDERYLGLGFGVQSMTSGGDAIIWLYDAGSEEFILSDRSFGYPGQPAGEDATGIIPYEDDNQDWTIVSNTTADGQRTVIATRLPDTGDTKDYVFSSEVTTLDLVWAFGFSYNTQYHGLDHRGVLVQSVTLAQDEMIGDYFKILQNPSGSKLILSIPQYFGTVNMNVFDLLGKKIISRESNQRTNTFDVSKWNKGIYLIQVSSERGISTKRFIKQ